MQYRQKRRSRKNRREIFCHSFTVKMKEMVKVNNLRTHSDF